MTKHAQDAIILLDSTGITKVWNLAAQNMFGHSESDILGKVLHKIIVPDYYFEAYTKGWKTLWETGEGAALGKNLELVGKRSDGSEFPIELSISRMDYDNEPNYIGIIRDISDRKEKETRIQSLVAELQRSNEDLENYNYVVSHDLKAPIRSMETFSRFVLDDNMDTLDEDSVLYLNRIINAAQRMDTLVNDLLQLSRVGRMFTQLETVNLNEVMEEVLQDLSGYISQKKGSVTYGDLPTMSTQKVWISQVFSNLITNGVKYNKSSAPVVQVSCSIKDDEYLFEFSDNGIGIDSQFSDKVFELFQRLQC